MKVFLNQEYHYPKVFIPETLHEILEGNLRPNYPQAPKSPDVPKLEESPFGNFLNFVAAFTGFISTVFILVGMFMEHNNRGQEISYGVVGLIICYVVYSFGSSINKEYEKKYQEKINGYDTQLKCYYQPQYAEYLNKIKEYEDYNKHENDEDFIKMLKRVKSQEFLNNCPKPSPITNSTIKKGVSELFFYKHLLWFFQSKVDILTGHTFVTGYSIISNPYVPDLIIYVKEINLTIDVEIDEPYTAEGRKPIHYIGGIDTDRNDFFTTIGWIVVRFSEEQIIRTPNLCCYLLTDIINNYKEIYDISKIDERIVSSPAWTRENAIELAQNDYRNTYLPNPIRP